MKAISKGKHPSLVEINCSITTAGLLSLDCLLHCGSFNETFISMIFESFTLRYSGSSYFVGYMDIYFSATLYWRIISSMG